MPSPSTLPFCLNCRLKRPMSAHSAVISPWSGQCSSHPFCTRGMRTSSDFWARVVATYKVLTTLTFVECSQEDRSNEKKKSERVRRRCGPNLPEHRTWALAGYFRQVASDPSAAHGSDRRRLRN